MKKLILISILFIVGCDNSTEPDESNLIDREFVVIKSLQSTSYLETPSEDSSTHTNCEGGTADCNG